jgi:hypothetical protein
VINKDFLPKHFVSKEQYDKKNGELKTANDQIEATAKEMTEMSKTAGIAEELKTALEAKEKEHAEYKTGIETRDANAKRSKIIKSALVEHGAIDDLLEARLDLSKIVFDTENSKILDGLTRQIDALKQERPHQFKVAEIVDPNGKPKYYKQAESTDELWFMPKGKGQ